MIVADEKQPSDVLVEQVSLVYWWSRFGMTGKVEPFIISSVDKLE